MNFPHRPGTADSHHSLHGANGEGHLTIEAWEEARILVRQAEDP